MNNLTDDQKKQVSKLLLKARLNLIMIGAKFAVGLFSANLVVLLVGFYFLKELSPEDLSTFESLGVFINTCFMISYLYKMLKANTESVSSKIKEILKK